MDRRRFLVTGALGAAACPQAAVAAPAPRPAATQSGLGVAGDLSLRLTEFPDPQGKCVYFRLADLSAAAADELVGDK